MVEQGIDQALVKIDASRIDLASASRHHARPSDAESISV
jgi:hypothetical protein